MKPYPSDKSKTSGYHEHKHYKPANEAEYEASCEGRDYNGVKSINLRCECVCGASFDSHHNGSCPK